MRNSIHNFAIIAWVFGLIVVAPMARADSGPVIVIPSRPGIPIIINGRDASYAVVEGDWGLSRPGHVAVTVIGASPVAPNEVYSRRNSYHPKYGSAPQRGRREIEPPADRELPSPAESFSRNWASSSDVKPVNDERQPRQHQARSLNRAGNDSVPATITDPETFPQNFNPPVVVLPHRRRH